jgi:hypothetical protein
MMDRLRAELEASRRIAGLSVWFAADEAAPPTGVPVLVAYGQTGMMAVASVSESSGGWDGPGGEALKRVHHWAYLPPWPLSS